MLGAPPDPPPVRRRRCPRAHPGASASPAEGQPILGMPVASRFLLLLKERSWTVALVNARDARHPLPSPRPQHAARPLLAPGFRPASRQALLEDQEEIRAAIRELANERAGSQREHLRDRLAGALERHFKVEETLLHAALAGRLPRDFLRERMTKPSDEIRAALAAVRSAPATDARFIDLVDELGRLVHGYFLHEEALLPASANGSPTGLYGRRDETGAQPRAAS
jgi:hypothetical protein